MEGEDSMKQSKLWIAVQIAGFVGIFLLLLVPVSYMVRTNGDVKDRFSGFYAEKKDSLDIVMIGSSPVFPYYAAPKLWGETGIAMYPLSSNVQRPAAMKYLVEETEKSQSPSLYVFEMRMFTIEDEGMRENMAYTRGVTDNMRYSLQRVRTIQALVPEEDEEGRLSYYLDIMKYHTNWKMLALPSEWANMAYRKAHPYKGYTFKDLLSFLQEEGKEGLFIVSPYGESLEEQQMYNYMEEIVTACGYRFLNMNNHYEEIGIVFEEDFADYGSHTNAVGAEKCTDFLREYLLEHYTFTDKRGEDAYQSWEESYDRWKTEMETARVTIADRIARGEYAEIVE